MEDNMVIKKSINNFRSLTIQIQKQNKMEPWKYVLMRMGNNVSKIASWDWKKNWNKKCKIKIPTSYKHQ